MAGGRPGAGGGGRPGGGMGGGRTGGGHTPGGGSRPGAGTGGSRPGGGMGGPGGGMRGPGMGGMGGPGMGGMRGPGMGGPRPPRRRGMCMGGGFRRRMFPAGGGCGLGCGGIVLAAVIVIIIVVLLISSLVNGLFGGSKNNSSYEENYSYTGNASGSSSTASSAKSSRTKLESGIAFDSDCITDELDWLDDISATGKSLETFYDLTGVQPYVYFKAYDSSLDSKSEKADFAEDWYNDNIDNEYTFLYVYFAEEESSEEVGYMYYVNGSEVDAVMDSDAIDVFWDYVDEYWYSDLSTDDMLTEIFTSTAEAIM